MNDWRHEKRKYQRWTRRGGEIVLGWKIFVTCSFHEGQVDPGQRKSSRVKFERRWADADIILGISNRKTEK